MIKHIVLIHSIISFFSFSQNSTFLYSQEDTQHFIPPLFSRIQPGIQHLFLSTTSKEPFPVRIFSGNILLSDTVVISLDKPKRVELGQRWDSPAMVSVRQINRPIDAEGLFLCAKKPFQAYLVNEARFEPSEDSLSEAERKDYITRLQEYVNSNITGKKLNWDPQKFKEEYIWSKADLKRGDYFDKGSMISKGRNILGTEFYVGCHLSNVNVSPLGKKESKKTVNNTKMLRTLYTTKRTPYERSSQFISIMATKDRTRIGIDNMSNNLKFHKHKFFKELNKSARVKNLVLNKGQSFTMAVYPDQIESYYDDLFNNFILGTRIISDKPISVLTGSLFSDLNTGFDQLLPTDKIGKNYILKEPTSSSSVDNNNGVLVIATENKTKIKINGILMPEKLELGGHGFYNTFKIKTGTMTISSNKNIYAFLISNAEFSDNFSSIPPMNDCDFQNSHFTSFLRLAQDKSVYTNVDALDRSVSLNAKSRMVLYGTKGDSVQVYSTSDFSKPFTTVKFLTGKQFDKRTSFVTNTISIPESVNHLYVKGSGKFMTSTSNAFASTPYYSGFSNSVKIHIDDDYCLCENYEICRNDSVRIYLEESDFLKDINWYKNDELLTSSSTSLYANGPGVYKVTASNSKESCEKDFKTSEDIITISESEDCIYPKEVVKIIEESEPKDLIMGEIKDLAIDTVGNSVFVPFSFEFGSASLQTKDLKILSKVAKYLRADPEISLEIVAHTDCRGSKEYNLELSNKRAKAVYDYLIDKKVEKTSLTYIGVGSSQPFIKCRCSICSEDILAKNRRVEFRIK